MGKEYRPKYKLTIKYPRLPLKFESGDIVYYNALSKAYVREKFPHYAVDVNEVENNPDFWELIEEEKPKPIWSDYYLNKYRWYRKCRKQTWYKHQFTNDALELSITFTGTWWALYGKINRYSDIVDTEVW